MHYSSGLMITINHFDALLRSIGDRLLADEDSRGGGFATLTEALALAPLHLLWLRRLVAAW
jgi:hypothetical protein